MINEEYAKIILISFLSPFLIIAFILFVFFGNGNKSKQKCVDSIKYNPKTGTSTLLKCESGAKK